MLQYYSLLIAAQPREVDIGGRSVNGYGEYYPINAQRVNNIIGKGN